jgi:putative transposase
MSKSVQGKSKQLIHEMYLAPTRKAALAAYDQFLSSCQTKFPKACECLEKDKAVLFTFYDFPAQHWPHLRIGGGPRKNRSVDNDAASRA